MALTIEIKKQPDIRIRLFFYACFILGWGDGKKKPFSIENGLYVIRI